jgi:hypothetical protein
VAISQITRCESPYACFMHDRFAGPRTRWRGTRIDVEPLATFEVVELGSTIHGDPIRVFDNNKRALGFVPSVPGATLGEILDESEQQGARLDPGFALAILEPVFELILQPNNLRAAISVDTVLVGFDGTVLFRGHLPWWGERRPSRAPLGFIAPDASAESMLLATELLMSTLTSRRTNAESIGASVTTGAGLTGLAQTFLRSAFSGAALPEIESLWSGQPGPNPLGLLAVLASLNGRGTRASPQALGEMVQNLFPVRFQEEQRVRDQLAEVLPLT